MNSLNIKIENMLQRFSCISFLFKPPWYKLITFKYQINSLPRLLFINFFLNLLPPFLQLGSYLDSRAKNYLAYLG